MCGVCSMANASANSSVSENVCSYFVVAVDIAVVVVVAWQIYSTRLLFFYLHLRATSAHTHFGHIILTLRYVCCVYTLQICSHIVVQLVCASVFNVCINIYALSDVHRRDDDG